MPTAKYRPRPTIVEAIRWTGEDNCAEVFKFLGWDHDNDETDHSQILGIGDDETAHPGNWVVRTPDDEHHVMTNEKFNEIFEAADDE